ncbi:MAG: DUF454 domain-containing protein [uncultured Sulfurovum sp.]|uniref:DUF454 domain-containing protein n=1 Tax=uncultured Sulfurovum sp. TaxID=269237 RepID=A0A6S6T3K1_9BACT|nr:MAG: DUF454 domain-containing protein [uncultured Sulfurovum sp.]
MKRTIKYFWLLLGLSSLGLAFLGVILPLLPTVPFLLLAAFFFAKSSDKLHSWLINHHLFGTMISDWHEKGAINKKAKYFATLSVALVLSLSLYLALKPLVLTIQIILLTLVLLFIWTRPNE